MGRIVVATLACGLALLAVTYADTFDGVDVDAILKNPEAVKGYVNCILGKGECNDSSKRLKDIVPNALLEKCSKCTPFQKRMIGLIAAHMSAKNPQQWDTILDKYDPKKEHRTEIAEMLKNAQAAQAASASATAGSGSSTTAKTAAGAGASTSTTAKPKTG